MKVRKTIAGRRKMSKLLQIMNPGFGTCECCGTPWCKVDGKALAYKHGCSFFPICELCYYDEQVTFGDLLIYYKREDEHAHTDEQTEFIRNSLMEEVETDDIIKEKYEKYLYTLREEKIDSIL